MRLIDADRLLQCTKFYNLKNGNRAIDEIDILHAQTVKAIPIPEGATNGDMIKAMFPNVIIQENANTLHLKYQTVNSDPLFFVQVSEVWWNAPYKEDNK